MYFFWGLHFASPKLRKSINPRQNWDFGKNAESRSDHAECCLDRGSKGSNNGYKFNQKSHLKQIPNGN